MWLVHEKIDAKKASEYVLALPEADRAAAEKVYRNEAPQGEAQVQAGRDALAFAVRFPLILCIVFGAIALWFRSKGGYKPIVLDAPWE